MVDKDPRYEINNPEIKQVLLNLGAVLKKNLPDGWGFTLFLFEFSDESFLYLSSANRNDMIKIIREFIQREQAN